MALACEVVSEDHITRSKTARGAIADPDFHLPHENKNVLSAGTVQSYAKPHAGLLSAESDGGGKRFQPSSQPTFGLASEVSGYPDKASAGLVLDQVQFSRISGAASATAGTALLIERGYSFANTIQAIDIEVAQIGLTINSRHANRNTFVSPYFNCPTPIVANAGDRNLLLNPSYGAAQPPAPGSVTGVISLP